VVLRKALQRSDLKATSNLLTRALDLRDVDDPAVSLRLDLGDALGETGSSELAVEAAERAAELARRSGDRVGEQRAALHAVRRNWWLEVGVTSADLLAAAEQARLVFEQEDRGLAEVHLAIAELEGHRNHIGAQLEALAAALTHARRAGDHRTEREILFWMGFAQVEGPTPVREALAWIDAQKEGRQHEPLFKDLQAHLLAMHGRFDEARTLIDEYRAQSEDLGLAHRGGPLWLVEGYAGNRRGR